MVINEEQLKLLKKYNVKSYKYTPMLPGAQFECEVEFFPSVSEEIAKKTQAEKEAEAQVNPSTGLTREQSRDLLGMEE